MLPFVRRVAVLAVLFAVQAHAQAPSVNGKLIPAARIDAVVKQQTARGVPDTPELRNAIKNRLVTDEVIYQEAIKRGLDKKPENAALMDLAQQNVLVSLFVQDYAKSHPIEDTKVKTEYDRLKAEAAGKKEYKARHILLESEKDAQHVVERLKKGEKFEKLAQEKSKDPGSKQNGGDLGWADPANFVKPFAEALTKLEKGKMTTVPVKSDFGWHIIRLDDLRAVQVPPFEQVKAGLQQSMQQQQIGKMIEDLKTRAKVD